MAVSAQFWHDNRGVLLLDKKVRFASMQDGDLVLSVHSASPEDHGELMLVVTFDACEPGADFANPCVAPGDSSKQFNLSYEELPEDLRWLESMKPDIGPAVRRSRHPEMHTSRC